MDKYRPICPQDLALSGDVVEEQRLGQSNDTLAWFWHIGTTNDEQGMSGWMSVSDEAGSPLVLFHNTLQKVYRVNWLRARHGWIGGKKKSHWSRTKQGGCTYHRNIWEGRAKKSEQEVLKGHVVMLGSRCGCGQEWKVRPCMFIVGLL